LKDYYENLLDDGIEHMENCEADLFGLARDAFLALFSNFLSWRTRQRRMLSLAEQSLLVVSKVLPTLFDWGRERYNKLSQILVKQPFLAHIVSGLSTIGKPSVQTCKFSHYEESKDVGLESSVWPFVDVSQYT
jgi:hypothetical protein